MRYDKDAAWKRTMKWNDKRRMKKQKEEGTYDNSADYADKIEKQRIEKDEKAKQNRKVKQIEKIKKENKKEFDGFQKRFEEIKKIKAIEWYEVLGSTTGKTIMYYIALITNEFKNADLVAIKEDLEQVEKYMIEYQKRINNL